MVVTAVTGVDDRDTGLPGGHQGRTLLGVTHGDDVGVAAHGLDRVGDAFALGGGAVGGGGEADDVAAQLVHGRLKAQAGACRGLKEQGGQLFAVADLGILGGIGDDVLGGGDKLLNLSLGQVGDAD